VVFTLPPAIGAIGWQNKATVYGLLFKAAPETMLTIAADPKHLGARIGMTAVLHSWGSALTHHPHLHMIVPGGGLSLDGERFVPCRRGFFLPVRVLSRLFRRLVLERLAAAYGKGLLMLQGGLAKLAPAAAFAAALKPLRRMNWFVYAKRPFAGPKAVLAYLSRYTHRVAISNTRLIAHDRRGVTFHYKDYRADGLARRKAMTLAADEFIRRFLLHILPKGFHRIRYYGLFANTGCSPIWAVPLISRSCASCSARCRLRFGAAILPSVPDFSGCYRQHPACRRQKQAQATYHRRCPPA